MKQFLNYAIVTRSVTRLGDFWKFTVVNFISEVAQIFGDFFERHQFLNNATYCGYFLGLFLQKFGQLVTFDHTIRDTLLHGLAIYHSSIHLDSI